MKTPFIVFDGMDGSGKGTQIKLLQDRVEKEGRQMIFTREPGGVSLSEEIREMFKSPLGASASSLTQFLMMWAARNECVSQLIVPNMRSGIAICSDRSDSSTYAYQLFAKNAHGLKSEFWRIRELVFGDFAPTRYIIFDVSAEESRRRALADSTHTSDFDTESLEWYERVRAGFIDFAHANAITNNTVIIDASRDPQTIHEEVYKVVALDCGW